MYLQQLEIKYATAVIGQAKNWSFDYVFDYHTPPKVCYISHFKLVLSALHY